MGLHFVLVHGGTHGAWCWYKLVDRLQKAGHKATTVDLAGCGTHPADPNTITTFSEYTKPLLDLLSSVAQEDGEKVVLIIHSMGGLSGLLAMESFSHKIDLAIFIAAVVVRSGIPLGADKPLNDKVFVECPIGEAVEFHFKNGLNNPPTSLSVAKAKAADIFHSGCDSEDIVLWQILERPLPTTMFATDCIVYTKEKHGIVPSVYIKCSRDNTLLPEAQNYIVNNVLSFTEVVEIDTGHSPFFEKVDDLVQLILLLADKHSK